MSGWNRPQANVPQKTKTFRWKYLAIIVITVVALGVIIVLLRDKSVNQVHQKPQSPNKKIETAPNAVPAQETSEIKSHFSTPQVSNIKSSELTTSTPPVEENSLEDSSQPGTNRQSSVKRVFTNPMDQLLSMVMPKEVGDSVPPLPISDDLEFTPEQEKQMFEQLTAEENDSEEVLDRKELVQSLRDEYAELKEKRGWKFIDYIKALQAKVNLDAEIATESWSIHETVFNDPNVTDEKYLETLEKINQVLSGRGIKPIEIPTDEEEQKTE